jgi:hypothetical protein
MNQNTKNPRNDWKTIAAARAAKNAAADATAPILETIAPAALCVAILALAISYAGVY